MGRNIEEIQWCSVRGLDSETLEEEGEKDVWSWRECSQTLDYPFNEATRCHCFITKRKWERSRFHGVGSSFPTARLASALLVPSVIPSRGFPASSPTRARPLLLFWLIFLKLLSANYHPRVLDSSVYRLRCLKEESSFFLQTLLLFFHISLVSFGRHKQKWQKCGFVTVAQAVNLPWVVVAKAVYTRKWQAHFPGAQHSTGHMGIEMGRQWGKAQPRYSPKYSLSRNLHGLNLPHWHIITLHVDWHESLLFLQETPEKIAGTLKASHSVLCEDFHAGSARSCVLVPWFPVFGTGGDWLHRVSHTVLEGPQTRPPPTFTSGILHELCAWSGVLRKALRGWV